MVLDMMVSKCMIHKQAEITQTKNFSAKHNVLTIRSKATDWKSVAKNTSAKSTIIQNIYKSHNIKQ